MRHINDTIPLNSVSKATLRLACHQISLEHNQVDYFPAYEIMMDDLRDYRFYKDDLIHPTTAAEDYIWEKLAGVYFNKPTLHFLKLWNDVKKALTHRPFQPESKSHKKFLTETLTKLEELKSVVDLEAEISQIKSELARGQQPLLSGENLSKAISGLALLW